MTTSTVSRDAVSAAVSELAKWMHGRSASSKPQLLLDDRDDFFILLLSLRRIPGNSRTNPFFLPLPHPIFPLSDLALSPSVLLIIDDRKPGSASAAKFLQDAKQSNLPVSEVIGISTLRTDYRPFESRRKLCGSYDLFLADKKILPLLPRLLGKTFFQKKKIPLPVNFSRVGWKDQIKRILGSACFYLRSGTCSGIKVGRLSMDVGHVVDNVMSVIDEAVQKIPKKWGNVRSLHLKAVDSVALPVYQAVPEIGFKIEIGEKEDSGADEVIDEVVEKKKENKKKKGGVRYMDGAALIGEELVEEDGEKEGEKKEKKKKNKKRKNRSKEGTDAAAIKLDDKEVKAKRTKNESTGVVAETKAKKKDNTEGKSDKLETEVKTPKKKTRQEGGEVEDLNSAKRKKKDNTGSKSDKIETEVKTPKKKTSQGGGEVNEVSSAKAKKSEKKGNVDKIPVVSSEIVEKMQGKEQRKGKKSEAAEEVKKARKTKLRV